jgi:type II secretory pathway predicted ATPase ExeA
MMFQQHFGLKYVPFGKNSPFLVHEQFTRLKENFINLLHSPGIGVLTGEPGVGKTAALRSIIKELNPHQYPVFYLSETQFTSFDIYRQIAFNLGLVPHHRFANLWRDIKHQIRERVENKRTLPIFIIDEAQNLPFDFYRGFPSFLNFEFDARDMMTVWFLGHPALTHIIDRVAYAALSSRIHVRCQLQPMTDREHFAQFIQQAFKEAGAQSNLMTESGMEILRLSSQGKPRHLHHILVGAMELATQKGLNFLPDDILQEAITQLKG